MLKTFGSLLVHVHPISANFIYIVSFLFQVEERTLLFNLQMSKCLTGVGLNNVVLKLFL